MPRTMRVEYPGAIYHVMNRGDRRESIFVDDVDRQSRRRGMKTLAEACQKTDWKVHAYCLMRTHFHLVVETPNANLVEGMGSSKSMKSMLHHWMHDHEKTTNNDTRCAQLQSQRTV